MVKKRKAANAAVVEPPTKEEVAARVADKTVQRLNGHKGPKLSEEDQRWVAGKVYFATTGNRSYAELERDVKKHFPKKDAKEVIRFVSHPTHGGMTGHAWPVWCGGDEPQGVCACEFKCSFHNDPTKPATRERRQHRVVKNQRCKACRRGDHKRHKPTFRKKGLPVECECAACDESIPKPALKGADKAVADKKKGAKKAPKVKKAPKTSKPIGDSWTVPQAAAELGTDAKTVRRTARKLKLSTSKEGGSLILTTKHVDKLRKAIKA